MRFYELDQIIKEHKNYKIVAQHIVENSIDLNGFLNNTLASLNESEGDQPGFFQKIKQNLGNMWNKFRGNPYDVESVTQILQKVHDFLSNSPEMQKKYGEEIGSLANIVKNINTKSTGESSADTGKPDPSKPTESNPKPEVEAVEPNPRLVEAYLKRLTYGKPVETLESLPSKENYKFYAKELAAYPQQNEIENVKNKLLKDLNEKIAHVEKTGVSLMGTDKFDVTKLDSTNDGAWSKVKSQYLNHETWALWDIGKQLYLSKNPSRSGEGYKLGNPITDEKLQQDMVNRMVGWAVTGGVNPVNHKKLSSKDLITIGERALNEKTLFSSPPETTPAPTVA